MLKLTLLFFVCAVAMSAQDSDGKIRVIAFGAHPDDCELKAAGTAAKWAALGHAVKMVSVTNGDIGHWQIKGEELAKRRLAETKAADKILGVETEVLPIHDGELEPTLENRRTITRLIRQWKADIVIAHRPWDYHPDHRYVGVLVQDAAYMVQVPFFCPDVRPLAHNPVFLFYPDSFQKPNPFQPDVIVDIDRVMEKKLDALDLLESQFYEGGALGSSALMPSDPAKQADRRLCHRIEDLAARCRAGDQPRERAERRELVGALRGATVDRRVLERHPAVPVVGGQEPCKYVWHGFHHHPPPLELLNHQPQVIVLDAIVGADLHEPGPRERLPEGVEQPGSRQPRLEQCRGAEEP